MHKLKLPIRRGGFNSISHQVLDANHQEIAVITTHDPDVAKSIIDLCNKACSASVPEHNKIHATYMCQSEYDGHVFDCYGISTGPDIPEVHQIANAGCKADITHILDPSVVKSIYADVERQWLDAQQSITPISH